MATSAVQSRLANTCTSHTDSLAWRSFGGPQKAVWNNAADADKTCLLAAQSAATTFMDTALQSINECLAADSCDAASVTSARQAAGDTAIAAIEGACAALSDVIATTPATFIKNTSDHVDCITAAAYADTAPLNLSCGPQNVAHDMPARGEWKQLILDRNKWGTQCGDGGDYAIQVRLAPEGNPLDKVIVGLQGGGVCLFEGDCTKDF